MPFDQKPLKVVENANCKILAVGIDTLRETFNVVVRPQVLEELQAQKEAAQEIDYNGAASFRFGDETATMGPAARGIRFYVICEGFDVSIRHTPDWNVTVRFSSLGLWQIGVDLLRERALDLIRKIAAIPYTRDDDGVITEAPARGWHRITDVHVSVDLHSLALGVLMVPGFERSFVIASQIEANTWWSNQKFETVTVGSKKSVQISIYDKGKEIRDSSGKTWFREIWDRSGFRVENFENIWRVELRLAGAWLKDRDCFTFDDFRLKSVQLCQDALWTRRLCEPGETQERYRWPLHWLWQSAMLAVSGELVAKPLGLRLQRDTEALPQMLKLQAAGVVRTTAVVQKALNPHDRRSVDDIAREVWSDVKAMLFQDKGHEEKKARTFERYRKIANPR